MKRKKKTPFRNRNHTGWWVASYLLRFEYQDEDTRNPNRRCKAWENTVLVKAKDREAAYKRAISVGRMWRGLEFRDEGTHHKGALRFEGLTSLLPVYQRLEDGAEILYREYRGRTVKSVKSMVRAKRELEAFDDSE